MSGPSLGPVGPRTPRGALSKSWGGGIVEILGGIVEILVDIVEIDQKLSKPTRKLSKPTRIVEIRPGRGGRPTRADFGMPTALQRAAT